MGMRLGLILAAALVAVPAPVLAEDRTIAEIVRKSEAKELDNGFCGNAPWRTTNDQEERQFLENAYVGSAEAVKFNSGACSYTQVEDVYDGANGKCVRYTWWACQPGYTCGRGQSVFCKTPQGTFARQP